MIDLLLASVTNPLDAYMLLNILKGLMSGTVPAERGMAAAWLMLAWWLEGKAAEEAGAKLPALEPPLEPLLLPGV